MKRKQKYNLRNIFAIIFGFLMIFNMLATPMLTYAATPSNFLYWNQLTPNAVSLSGGNGYYQITDMQTLGTNASVNSWGSDGVAEGTYWTFNPMHVATSSRVAYQRLFSVNYGTTISLAAGKDGGENTTNTENIAWSVEEWDANGNFLWDSGWLYTNQSYTVGSSTNGSNLGISQSNLGSRSNVKYITLIFRRIADDGLVDNGGNVAITPSELATLFPNLYVCYSTFGYSVKNSSGTQIGWINRRGTESTTLKSYQPADIDGYTFSWKIDSSSSITPNWMNGNTYPATQVESWLSSGKFYNSLFGNVSFIACYVPNTYTLSYDANGGTTSAGTKIYAYGTGVDLSPSATKDGYTFVGWSTSSTARMPLTSLTMPASNVTLYAVYTREVSDVENHDYPSYAATESISNDEVYLLVWIKENSSVYRYYPLTYKYDTNTMVYKYELPATDISSFASGREFCYQLIAFDNAGNYTILKDGSSGTTPPLPPAEYLQTVKHYKQDANTGDWIWFDTTTSMVESGETFTPAYVTAPVGYSTSSKDTGGTVTAANTYNAYYKPNTYTITFHANGGSCSPATKSVLYSSYYGELPVPTRTGYTFLGWNTVSDGTGTTISSGDIYDTVGDETLYAKWRANVYTVTLDAQKATTPGTMDYYQKYDTGNYTSSDCTTSITSIIMPTKTGYTFGGYYTGKEGTGTQYVNALGVITSTNTTFSMDTTLYAYWVANTYSIQYNANGGSGTMANTTAAYDTCVMLSANTFERTGYTFEGWSTTADGTKVYEDKDSVKNLTTENGDIINLYAVWKCNSYNVLYDYWTNGGTSVTVDTDMISYDSPIDLTVVAEKGDGYTFVGWNTIPEATTGLDSLSMGTEHITLYAIFEKTITVTLIENSDSGTITTSISDMIYNNERFANFHIEEKGNWSGWKNIGWTDKSSATEDAIISTGAIYSTDNSSTLYARYESSVTVSYDTNGSTVDYDSQTKECYYNASGTEFYPTFTMAKAPVFSSYSFDKWVAEDGTEYAADTEAVIEKDTILTARWDKYPELSVSNRYFTLEQAQDGKITPSELLKKVVARDREDGILANGTDVIVKDYNASIFTNMTKASEVEITYQATDSFGNTVVKHVIVAIADTSMKKSMKKTYVRFISRDFFADDAGNMISVDKGGLEETSIWKLNPAYRSLLQSTLFYEKTDVESYFFTSQDIEWVKEYTNTYGNIQNAVEEFLEFLLAKSSILSY